MTDQSKHGIRTVQPRRSLRRSEHTRTMFAVLLEGELGPLSVNMVPDPLSSRSHNWLASGSFDRTIKLWDLSEIRKSPLMTFLPPESPGPKSSVYAMATDAMGKVLASGGPERVIRTWDPRTGKRIGKLVGHTDNIRAILISEDARYVSSEVLLFLINLTQCDLATYGICRRSVLRYTLFCIC